MVVGVGNIYASEALFRAGISPRLAARRLSEAQGRDACARPCARCCGRRSAAAARFRSASRNPERMACSTLAARLARPIIKERLLVYDRAGKPCPHCRTPIKRIVQAARSTFFCLRCQILANRLR